MKVLTLEFDRYFFMVTKFIVGDQSKETDK